MSDRTGCPKAFTAPTMDAGGGKPESQHSLGPRHPSVREVIAATDADDAGDKMAAAIMEALEQAGGVKVGRDRPPVTPPLKDWNDILMGSVGRAKPRLLI